MSSGSTCNCDQHKLGWKVLVAAEVRAKKKGSQGRRLWGGGRLFMELDFWGGQIIILNQCDECGFSEIGCGTQETFLALVWGEYEWVASHREVCLSRIWVGHGETSMRQAVLRERSTSGGRMVTRDGMKRLVDI